MEGGGSGEKLHVGGRNHEFIRVHGQHGVMPVQGDGQDGPFARRFPWRSGVRLAHALQPLNFRNRGDWSASRRLADRIPRAGAAVGVPVLPRTQWLGPEPWKERRQKEKEERENDQLLTRCPWLPGTAPEELRADSRDHGQFMGPARILHRLGGGCSLRRTPSTPNDSQGRRIRPTPQREVLELLFGRRFPGTSKTPPQETHRAW